MSEERTEPVVDDSAVEWPAMQSAHDELRDDMASAEATVTAEPRFRFLAHPESAGTGEYGTDAKEENVPPACLYSTDPVIPTMHDERDIEDVEHQNWKVQDLVDPVRFGSRPGWLDGGSPPTFDAYWFFEGTLKGGWNGAGMESEAKAGVYAGIAAIRKHVEILRASVTATGALLKQMSDDEGDVKPYFATRLETKLMGANLGGDRLNWTEDLSENDVLLSKLRRNLFDHTVLLFPDDKAAPRVQVGPFALILNAGAEIKVPLALNTDESGPEITFSPFLRTYVTIFAGVDVVILQLGVRGEADFIRIDVPFKAKLKWRDYLTPETCYAGADFDVTFKTKWSTLNGRVLVSVTGWAPIVGDYKIAETQIVKWDGLSIETDEVSLLPHLELPLLKHNETRCSWGGENCFKKADARATDVPDSWTVEVPYTNSECPDQHVFEIDMEGRDLNGVWLRHRWDSTEITSEDLCRDSMVQLSVWLQDTEGGWDEWDQFRVSGVPTTRGCETSHSGYIGPNERNSEVGVPWSWVDTTNIRKVRVAVTGGRECEQRVLVLGTAAVPL